MSEKKSCLDFAVDIGNSGLRAVQLPHRNSSIALPEPIRINWHLGDGELPSKRSDRFKTVDYKWTSLLKPLVDSCEQSQWWISSVNRPATELLINFLSECGVSSRLISYVDLPLHVDVEAPEKVGIDRLLAAYAACYASQSEMSIVIQAGSAVTVDLVQRYLNIETNERVSGRGDGRERDRRDTIGKFLGGAILPGVPMMLRLLGRAADMLPELDATDLIQLPVLPGKNTEAAMLAGTSSCLVGGVQHLISRYRQYGGAEVPVVISGGDGPLLLPFISPPVRQINQLVLEGIRMLIEAKEKD